MKKICDINQCIGCFNCKNVCPKKCISTKLDANGFLVPIINEDRCINCGMCQKVCPALNLFQDDRNKPKTFAVKNNNTEMVLTSSSGGVSSLLGEYIISRGGAIVGAVFDNCFNVAHTLIDDEKELHKINGSKYVQSNLKDTFLTIKERLNQNNTILFFGTPCQVAALKVFLGKEYERLFLVDIVCHAIPSPYIWEKYLNELKNKYNSNIFSVDFRCKDSGWDTYSIKIVFEDGGVFLEPAKNNKYFLSYMMGMHSRKSCDNCQYKQIHKVSDITLGDFWGIKTLLPDFYDSNGVSLVMINSDKGERLFNSISKKTVYKSVDFNDAIKNNVSVIKSSKGSPLRKRFVADANKKTFEQLFKKYCGNGFSARVRRKLSSIFKI